MKKVIRQILARNQVTIPARILSEHSLRPGDYVEITGSNGYIILKPARIGGDELSDEDWKRLDRLVKRQEKKEEYTGYRDAGSARRHTRKLK